MSIPAELLLTDEQLGALTEEELAAYQAALEAADNEWVLSDKQLYADQLADEVDRLMYGGAAGGGKSEWALYRAWHKSMAVAGHKTLILRRVFPELRRSLIERSLEKFDQRIATYKVGEKQWVFPNGSRIEFGYLDTEDDVYQYKSAEYDLIIFDELTEFTERQFYYLASRCRTTIKKRLAGARPHVIAMTNPGSVGHAWVKRDFVDATDYGTKIIERNGISFAFVPARVSDNPYIDPDYERNLRGMAETDRKQLLEGDWDVFEGQFFAEYNREVHVIKPFAIPEDWPRIRAIDYGYAAPFCCLWIAFDNDGVGYVYRELYETQLTPRLQAERVLELSGRERIDYTVLDPSTWAQTGVGDPIAVQYRMAGLHCKKAMNARRDGWARIREYLMMRDGPHGPQPGIFFFETCSNLLRTLPMQVYDDKNVEDLDTKGEDHAADALRYALMSRPRRLREKKKVPTTIEERLSAYIDRKEKANRKGRHPVLGKLH